MNFEYNNFFNYNINLIYKFNLLTDIPFILPELFIFSSLIFLILYSSFYSNMNIYKYIKLSYPLMNLISLSIYIYILLIYNTICFNNIISSYLLYNTSYISLVKIIIAILFVLIIKMSYNYLLIKNLNLFEFYLFLLLSFMSIIIIIMSYDFIVSYLAIELQGLCSYILVALNKTYNKSVESSLKYFILGSFASSILLLGIALIYWGLGMTNFKDISDFLQLSLNLEFYNTIFILGLLFIHIGLFLKIAVAPFHLWLPDVFYGSSKVIVLFFSLLPKIALIILLFKLNFLFLININWDLKSFYSLFIILSLIFGISGAIKVTKINKFLAYSSISHISFILCAIISYNFDIFLIYIIIYSIIIINIFLILFNMINPISGKSFETIFQLIYMKKINYMMFISLIVSFFSISGIPPLSGFFSKFLIFINLIEINLNVLVLLLLLFSVISCFYYLRIIKIISFNNVKNWFLIINMNKFISYLISLTMLINIYLFLILPFLWELFQMYSLV